MAKYLITTVETWRVSTEAEAAKMIEEAKQDNHYELKKSSAEKKEAKQKGEVVDEWVKVQLTKIFNIEKEPDSFVSINYEKESEYGAF